MKIDSSDPFSFFKEEFNNEDLVVRINAIRRLPTVAYASGINQAN